MFPFCKFLISPSPFHCHAKRMVDGSYRLISEANLLKLTKQVLTQSDNPTAPLTDIKNLLTGIIDKETLTIIPHQMALESMLSLFLFIIIQVIKGTLTSQEMDRKFNNSPILSYWKNQPDAATLTKYWCSTSGTPTKVCQFVAIQSQCVGNFL